MSVHKATAKNPLRLTSVILLFLLPFSIGNTVEKGANLFAHLSDAPVVLGKDRLVEQFPRYLKQWSWLYESVGLAYPDIVTLALLIALTLEGLAAAFSLCGLFQRRHERRYTTLALLTWMVVFIGFITPDIYVGDRAEVMEHTLFFAAFATLLGLVAIESKIPVILLSGLLITIPTSASAGTTLRAASVTLSGGARIAVTAQSKKDLKLSIRGDLGLNLATFGAHHALNSVFRLQLDTDSTTPFRITPRQLEYVFTSSDMSARIGVGDLGLYDRVWSNDSLLRAQFTVGPPSSWRASIFIGGPTNSSITKALSVGSMIMTPQVRLGAVGLKMRGVFMTSLDRGSMRSDTSSAELLIDISTSVLRFKIRPVAFAEINTEHASTGLSIETTLEVLGLKLSGGAIHRIGWFTSPFLRDHEGKVGLEGRLALSYKWEKVRFEVAGLRGSQKQSISASVRWDF